MQPGQSSRKRESLLVATENGGVLKCLHRQAEIVHHHAHCVGYVGMVSLTGERVFHLRFGNEQVG